MVFCLPPEGQGMLRFFFLGLLSKFVVSAEDFQDNFVLALWNRKFRVSKNKTFEHSNYSKNSKSQKKNQFFKKSKFSDVRVLEIYVLSGS